MVGGWPTRPHALSCGSWCQGEIMCMTAHVGLFVGGTSFGE